MKRSWAARFASAGYRFWLKLTPRSLRTQYGVDMQTTFDRLADEAAARGFWPVLALLVRESIDILRAGRVPADSHDANTYVAVATTRLRPRWPGAHFGRAARSLVRRPGFALTAALTLAAGTAATTVVFALVDLIVIRALPYPQADRLVAVQEASPATRERVSLVAPARLEDWQRLSRTFVALSGLYSEAVTDTSGPAPERLDGRRVTLRYFTVYGVDPILGRTFTADEEQFNGPGAAVISEPFWTRRYQRDPGVLARSLLIGGRPYQIVGVMPATFAAASIDVWLPAQTPPFLLQSRDARFLSGVGRMKPGVSIAQAHDDLDRVQRDLAVTFPKTDAGWSVELWDLKAFRLGDRSGALWLVFGAVALLWLIALTNVASLVLVRTQRRARELAIRVAIGASRGHVVGVVVEEIAVISTLGVLLGVGAAAWLLPIVKATFSALPRASELGLDFRVVAFAATTGVISAVLCGVVPALVVTRHRPASLISSGGRVAGGGAHRWQRTLVTAQVALSLLLSASAGLLLHSYYNLTRVDPGFRPDGAITFHVGARWDEDRTRVGELQVQLLDAFEHTPGVAYAGLTNFLPATGATLRFQVHVDGVTGPNGQDAIPVGERTIGGGYLRALGVPLLAGEWCRPLDLSVDKPFTVMVNRQFANRLAPGVALVGRALHFVDTPQYDHTISGIVGDVAEDGPQADRSPYVYSCMVAGAWPDPNYVVRTADPSTFVATVATIVHQLDPSRAVFGVRPLGGVLQDAVDVPRLNAGMIGSFAVGAVLLAAIGLYGLFTLVVAESRREIGVRLALGARPAQVVRMVVVDVGRVLLPGLAAGLALSILAHRVIAGLLFDLGALDAPTLTGAAVALTTVALVAIAVPAIRASRIAPTEVLRTD